jgi:hypothetical protein
MSNVSKTLLPIQYGRTDRCRKVKMSHIHASLEKIQAGLETPESKINAKLKSEKKFPLSSLGHRNLINAYEYLNILIKKPELQPKDILDLNDICMCGASFGSLKESKKLGLLLDYHDIKQSYLKKFNDHIRPTWEWLSAQTRDADISPYMIAAGLYTKIVNDSKLFTDGHQRTGSLMMAYILAKADIEPFYLKGEIAAKFFNISDKIKACGSMRPIKTFMLNRSRDQLARFLMDNFQYHYMRYDHLF